MTDTRRPHQLLVSLKYFRCKGIERCGRCPVSIDILYEVYAKEGEKVLHFDPPKRGDPPPSSELIALWYSSLLPWSSSPRNCWLSIAAQWYCGIRTMESPVLRRGEGRLHTIPCVRFNNEARPRKRSDRGRFLPSGKKASS